jgi:hypothetical protein
MELELFVRNCQDEEHCEHMGQRWNRSEFWTTDAGTGSISDMDIELELSINF